MLCPLALLLFVILIAPQAEGSNRTCLDRPKRRIQEDVIGNDILENEKDKRNQNGQLLKGQFTKSDIYESIFKDIGNIVSLKKDELSDNVAVPDNEDVTSHVDAGCRDSYEKGVDSDPLMTKFYTFSKMTSEEPKTFGWVDLLTSPIIQSLIRSKGPSIPRTQNMPPINFDKFNLEDMSWLRDQSSGKKGIDDANFNSIIQFFASLSNNCKKSQGRETEVGFTNQLSPSNDIMEDKLSPSCLVENKSNFFKTDHCPYNKFICSTGTKTSLDLMNSAIGNYSNPAGRLKGNFPESMPYINDENIKTVDQPQMFLSDQVPKSMTQYKVARWPDIKSPRINVYNFTKNGHAMNIRLPQERKVFSNYSKNSKNSLDVLREISLDPPSKASPYNETRNSKSRFNITIPESYIPEFQTDLQRSLGPDQPNNALNLNFTSSLPSLEKFDPNLIQSPDTLEKIYLLNNIVNGNPGIDPAQCIYCSSNGAISPLIKNALESKLIDSKCDIRALTNYLLSRKLLSTFKPNPDNKTTSQRSDKAVKCNVSNADVDISEVQAVKVNSTENKTSAKVIAIGEQPISKLYPLDVKPGSPKIILPEYEKMDYSCHDQSTKPLVTVGLPNVYFEPASTTQAAALKAEMPPSAMNTETLKTLHRNMIPVIDFLGQMWNSTSRKSPARNNTGFNSSNDGDSYVIVPLPENSIFKYWKPLDKTVGLISDAEFSDSRLFVNSSNNSNTEISESSKNLLEKYVLKSLFDSFRGSFGSKKRARRSQPTLPEVEDNNFQARSTVPPLNSTQLPPTNRWTMNSSLKSNFSNNSSPQ